MRTIGVDLGVRKLAYSVWDDDQLLATYAYESDLAHRASQLFDLGNAIFDGVQTYTPDNVFIEDTLIGNNRKYSIQLSQTMGAVLTELGGLMLDDEFGIYTVNVSTWKKGTVNNGKASKLEVREYVDSMFSPYSHLCEGDQDRYDAACIGYYGYLTCARAKLLLPDAR